MSIGGDDAQNTQRIPASLWKGPPPPSYIFKTLLLINPPIGTWWSLTHHLLTLGAWSGLHSENVQRVATLPEDLLEERCRLRGHFAPVPLKICDIRPSGLLLLWYRPGRSPARKQAPEWHTSNAHGLPTGAFKQRPKLYAAAGRPCNRRGDSSMFWLAEKRCH
jgi:hypothetical protein